MLVNVSEHVNVDVAVGLSKIVFAVVQAEMNVNLTMNTNTHMNIRIAVDVNAHGSVKLFC